MSSKNRSESHRERRHYSSHERDRSSQRSKNREYERERSPRIEKKNYDYDHRKKETYRSKDEDYDRKKSHSRTTYNDSHKKEKRQNWEHSQETSNKRKFSPSRDSQDKRSYRNREEYQRVREDNTSATNEEQITAEPKPPKEKINFGTSGKLSEDTNEYNGVIVKYSQPEEAKKPSKKWRLYPFKGDTPLDHIEIHKQSAFLIGRDRRVADIAIDHPSCSKQHAVIQFRMVEYEKEDGMPGRRIRPYLMDLEAGNGTFLNNQQLDPKKYYELFEKDVIKFGYSSREYVVMTDSTKDN